MQCKLKTRADFFFNSWKLQISVTEINTKPSIIFFLRKIGSHLVIISNTLHFKRDRVFVLPGINTYSMFTFLNHNAHTRKISRVSEVFSTNWKETLNQQVVVEWNIIYAAYIQSLSLNALSSLLASAHMISLCAYNFFNWQSLHLVQGLHNASIQYNSIFLTYLCVLNIWHSNISS